MSATDDIEAGIVCMSCLQMLVSEDGELCQCGHPVVCEECHNSLPEFGDCPWFDEETGRVNCE